MTMAAIGAAEAATSAGAASAEAGGAAGARAASGGAKTRASRAKPRASRAKPKLTYSGTYGGKDFFTDEQGEHVESYPAELPKAPKAPKGGKSKGYSAQDFSRQASRTRKDFTPEFKNYQGIILAEFVAAELLVAMTPIASRQNQPGLSPYVPRDLTKLLSLGLLYFILELMSIGGPKYGRVGAWFGGLILIVVGMNEASNIAKTLNIFGTQNPPAATQPNKTPVPANASPVSQGPAPKSGSAQAV